jgi:phosphopantetheine adenylyltransferase
MTNQDTRKAEIHCLARRLRAARDFSKNKEQSLAYEKALKMLIEEFFLGEEFHKYYFGV